MKRWPHYTDSIALEMGSYPNRERERDRGGADKSSGAAEIDCEGRPRFWQLAIQI